MIRYGIHTDNVNSDGDYEPHELYSAKLLYCDPPSVLGSLESPAFSILCVIGTSCLLALELGDLAFLFNNCTLP